MNPANSVLRDHLRACVCWRFFIFFLAVPVPAPAVSGSLSSFFGSFTSVMSQPRFGYVRPSEGVLSVFPGRFPPSSAPAPTKPLEDLSKTVFTAPVQESSIPFFSHRGFAMHGYVISAGDEYASACEPLTLKWTKKLSATEYFILLVASATATGSETSTTANCSHFIQALHAQEAGYKAVIIYNVGSNSTDDLDLDSGTGSVHIPVYFVGEYDGLAIRDWYTLTYSHTFFVTIRIPSPLIAMLVLYGIWFGLLLVLLLAFYQYIKPCCMYFIHPWCVRVARRRKRAALIRELTRFPVVIYTIERSQSESCAAGTRAQCICVICMEEYVDGDHLRVLYCSHGFHQACIDKWLVHRARCPICKATLRYAGQGSARACCRPGGRFCSCVDESEWSADEDEEVGVDFYGVEPGLDPAHCMNASRTTRATAVEETPTREI